MMRLKIVKEEENYSSTDTEEEGAVMLHGVKVLKELIGPWTGSVVLFVQIPISFQYKLLKC